MSMLPKTGTMVLSVCASHQCISYTSRLFLLSFDTSSGRNISAFIGDCMAFKSICTQRLWKVSGQPVDLQMESSEMTEVICRKTAQLDL